MSIHQHYRDLAEQRGHDVRLPCKDCDLPVGDDGRDDHCRCEDPRCDRCDRISDDIYDCEDGSQECPECNRHCQQCLAAEGDAVRAAEARDREKEMR